MKQALLIALGTLGLSIAMTTTVHADVLNDSILKTASGSVQYLNFQDATHACPAGTHLPTIREIADAAVQRHAAGILEMNQVNPSQVPAGYELVSALNLDGSKDDFYFNKGQFEALDGEAGSTFVWSSSVDRGDVRKAFAIMGNNAYTLSYFRGNTFAVACFPTK